LAGKWRHLCMDKIYGLQGHKTRFTSCWYSLFLWRYKNPNSKIARTFKFWPPANKRSLKINFCASFQRESFFPFENIALSNFPSSLRVTLIWRPRSRQIRYKNNFIAWYYALWMVKLLVNGFREIICSFAVNNWSNLWRYWNQMFALFPAAIFVPLGWAQIWRPHSEPYTFLLHIFKNNSAAENCTDVSRGQVVILSIFYLIRNNWLKTFHGFDFSFRWRDSEIHP